MVKLKIIINEILEEWHENAELEAYFERLPSGIWEFWFFRNGIFAGEIRGISKNGYMAGFGVKRSLQGTGFGKAMLNYAFEKTELPEIGFHSSAHQFYHKIGGRRQKRSQLIYTIKKEQLKPSSIRFTDIDEATKNKYLINLKKDTNRFPRLDAWPSRK